MSTTYARERTLQDEIAPAIESRVPGVEVLAVELLSPTRFCVYVDHADGVDHALCERVTYASSTATAASGRSTSRRRDRSVHCASRSTSRTPSARASPFGSREARKNRHRGVLVEAGEESITLQPGDAGEIRIPYDAIVRANLIDEGLTT